MPQMLLITTIGFIINYENLNACGKYSLNTVHWTLYKLITDYVYLHTIYLMKPLGVHFMVYRDKSLFIHADFELNCTQ